MAVDTDYPVVLVLVDWDNMYFQAKDAIALKYRGKKDLYTYRLLIELVRIAGDTAGAARELRMLIFTNNANSLPAICHELSKSPGIDVQVIAGASRIRQRDKDKPGKTHDEEDPVDLSLLATAKAHLESPRVNEIYLATGDGGFAPDPKNDWTVGKPWRLITVADIYNQREHMRMVSERLKRAMHKPPLNIDPQKIIYTETSTYDFEQNVHAASDGTMQSINVDFFMAVYEKIKKLVKYAQKNLHDDYSQTELVRATWRSLMLDWAPHGFLKRHVTQVVEILKSGALAKRLEGMLYDPRSQEALTRHQGSDGEPAEPLLIWEDGKIPTEVTQKTDKS